MNNIKKLQIFIGKNVMITGGLGFIGSNLAHELVKLKSKVLIIDSLSPLYGGNMFNVSEIKDKCEIVIEDVRNQSLMNRLVKRQDFIFNLTGQVSHIDSLEDPLQDLESNCRTHLVLLEACKNYNPKVKIVFAGTRGQYGKPVYLPVDEKHPMNPIEINGINKMAAEAYHLLYYRNYGLKTTSLRLTNAYGQRHQMKNSKQGFLNWFIRLAIDDKWIKIFGDGEQQRDFTHVEDVVKAFLISAVSKKADGQVFNLGSDKPVSIINVAKLMVELSRSGEIKKIDFPETNRKIEVGDYHANYTKIKKILGWKPNISLMDGVKMTIEYYKKNREHYWR